MPSLDHARPLNLLIASATSDLPDFTRTVIQRLSLVENVRIRSIIRLRHDHALAVTTPTPNLTYYHDHEDYKSSDDIEREQEQAAELCSWADLLVLAPIDADSLARMLHGMTNNLHLEILRSWDVSKKILIVPGMSTLMWENPMTKKQLSKIRRKWNWIRVLQPVLWSFEPSTSSCNTSSGTSTSTSTNTNNNSTTSGRKQLPWDGQEGLLESVQTQVDLLTIGRGLDLTMPHPSTTTTTTTPASALASTSQKRGPALPPELWSLILTHTGDWELATALNVHTALPVPEGWHQAASKAGPATAMQRLEWTLLVGSLKDVKAALARDRPSRLSRLCIRLIMRFGPVSLLCHLETAHRELFWSTFGHAFLPVKASTVFARTDVLEYWRTSPAFLTKEYSAEAMDAASRAGFVHVLEWWWGSGLPLKYSEAALEQASSAGHIAVLEWWKQHALQEGDGAAAASSSSSSSTSTSTLTFISANSSTVSESGAGSGVVAGAGVGVGVGARGAASPPLRLKVGKSISYATQSGSLPVLRWWCASGIAFPHEDTVAKLASTHGHVPILDFWRRLRGEKMLFDNQVLVGATKMGHADVLEWWKRSGLRVEYKTCDIEEALEDGVEGERGRAVRRWWARNGLNLGVGTSEWMRTKVLCS